MIIFFKTVCYPKTCIFYEEALNNKNIFIRLQDNKKGSMANRKSFKQNKLCDL